MSLAQTINRYAAAGANFSRNENGNQSIAFQALHNAAKMHAAVNNYNKNKTSKIFIKNMVCMRCKIVVSSLLEVMGLQCVRLELGEAEIMGTLTAYQHEHLSNALLKTGLELLEDRKIILVEKIKNLIIEIIYHSDDLPETKNSVFLSEKLNYNYNYLAYVFSEAEGISIEQFIIKHKVARVKELIVYGELTLSEIAWKLNYSSVAHLSNQFKKVTGLTPSDFKAMKQKKIMELEKV